MRAEEGSGDDGLLQEWGQQAAEKREPGRKWPKKENWYQGGVRGEQ